MPRRSLESRLRPILSAVENGPALLAKLADADWPALRYGALNGLIDVFDPVIRAAEKRAGVVSPPTLAALRRLWLGREQPDLPAGMGNLGARFSLTAKGERALATLAVKGAWVKPGAPRGDDALERLRAAIAKYGAHTKPATIIEAAGVRRTRGLGLLRTLESRGAYAGFDRPRPARYRT